MLIPRRRFNNSDKGAVSHAIVHRVLWEYLSAVNDMEEAEAEKFRREMFETCVARIHTLTVPDAHALHRDLGAKMSSPRSCTQKTAAESSESSSHKVPPRCVTFSLLRCVQSNTHENGSQDRKVIVKALKPHVVRMCTDDEAQLVLFSALDIIEYAFFLSFPPSLSLRFYSPAHPQRHKTHHQIPPHRHPRLLLHPLHHAPRPALTHLPRLPTHPAALHPRANIPAR